MKFPILRTAVLAGALLLGACGSDATEVDSTSTGDATTAQTEDGSTPADGATRLWIKPDLVDCEGAAPQTCMQIAESEDGEYEWFYDQIDGFAFVEGTSYVIDVKIDDVEDPPADGSSLKYTLVKVVSES